MAEDYLAKFARKIEYGAIQEVREERQAWFQRQSNQIFEAAMHSLPDISTSYCAWEDVVSIGAPEELSEAQQTSLQDALKAFIPWRKGPFNIFGMSIDAEWRSDWKWQRILPELQDLKGKRVADVGCNNGYYLFRLASLEPELAIGLDPTVRYWYTFQFLQKFAQRPNLQFELLGVEHIHHFPKFFDTVLCLGILYHHPDPIGILRKMLTSLKPGGQLIVESAGIPGNTSMALFPEKRYAKVPGTWFVPTLPCLVNWIHRAGFREVTSFGSIQLNTEEQRRTEWAPYESLSDFLDPTDLSLTVEGYPAPWRFYVKAVKPKH